MKIKVDVFNEIEIENIKRVLDTTETGCSARLLDITDIPYATRIAMEKLFSLEIPRKYWLDCEILITPPKPPNNYQYRAEGTYCKIKRFKTGWFIINIWRGDVHTESYGALSGISLTLSELAIQNIPRKYRLK